MPDNVHSRSAPPAPKPRIGRLHLLMRGAGSAMMVTISSRAGVASDISDMQAAPIAQGYAVSPGHENARPPLPAMQGTGPTFETNREEEAHRAPFFPSAAI